MLVDLSDRQLEKLDRLYEEKIKKVTGDSQEEIDRKVEQLIIEQADIIGKALVSEGRRLDTDNTSMHEKYQRKLDEAAKKLQAKISKKEQEISAMNEDYTSKIYQGKSVQLEVLKEQKKRIEETQSKVTRRLT